MPTSDHSDDGDGVMACGARLAQDIDGMRDKVHCRRERGHPGDHEATFRWPAPGPRCVATVVIAEGTVSIRCGLPEGHGISNGGELDHRRVIDGVATPRSSVDRSGPTGIQVMWPSWP
jgi:hypothetical protein